MNKMKKLLSVVLAVVIALSALSVLGSAARANYKTAANLANDGSGDGLDAYSPYGQVTRLSTEERMSIILDSLDMLLAPMTSLNMGTLVDTAGITVRINLTSVDGICDSIDSFKNSMSGFAWIAASAIVNLGVLEDLNFDNWKTDMSRDGTAQLTIIRELLELLHDNAGTIANIVRTGNLDLGLVSSIANINIDLSIIANIPGLIKGLVYPMIERWDDTLSLIKEYDNSIAGTGKNVEAIANMRVKKLFNDNMSITTVKYDDKGNMTSEHKGMPIQTTVPGAPSDESPRCVYVVNGTTPGSVMTVYHIVDAAEAKDSGEAVYSYVAGELTYTLTEEDGNGVYVWKSTDDQGNVTTLKWYNDDSKLLDGFSGADFDLRTMSLAEILYKFIPPVFENMAPVVLNGSVKKILAEFLGAKFTYVGEGGPEADDAVMALADSSDAFFTEEQGEYLWEWSNYAIINGNHYWRYEDQIWAGDLSQKNNYFDIINWEYNISDDFMNEFLPKANEGKGSAEDTLLMNLNNFIIKVADQALLPSAETVDAISGFEATWTRPNLEELKGGNDKLVGTIKAIAQAVIGLAPQHVFGSDWATNERCYVELMLDSNNDVVLTGIAAHLVNMLMPSMSLPGKSDLVASGAKVGAILAAVIREFAAYLAPEYNFDALIYTDFGTTSSDKIKSFLTGKDAGYWLDVCLTMGINVGFEYLRAFADMGEGTDEWNAFVSYSGYGVDGKTYAAGTTQAALNAEWEGMLDYVLDWALEKDYEWTWKMENLVDTTGLTIDLKTAQDPWVKLDKILNDLLPADEILNVTATDCETELEQLLRYDLILALVELRWGDLVDLLKVPAGFVRNTNALDQLAGKIKGIVNYLFKKVGGGSYEFIPSAVTDFDSLANQGNLATLVEGLLSALVTAQDRGLLDTALPIVNLFVGWKMDPQAYADPVIYYENPNNLPYIYVADGTTVSTTLKVANNASGMLETHRNSSVVDAPYVLTIMSVTCDDSNIKTTTSLPAVVQPYGTADIAISGTYSSDKVVRFTVVYTFTGKDGKAIGGEQTMQTYMYISNKTDYNYQVEAYADGYQVNNTAVSKVDAVRVQREAFNAIKYGASVKDIVENFTIKFTNTSKRDYSQWVYSNTISNNPTYVTANQTWVHGCTDKETLKANHKGWMNGDTKENTVNPLAWVANTDTSAMESGWVSNLGSLATVWHNHKKGSSGGVKDGGDVKVTINTPDLGEIRIVNTSELTAKADSYANVMASDFDLTTTEAQNAWAAFDTALRNAYTTAKMPYHMSDAAVFTATFSVDAQQALADALDEAYDALKVYSKASGANVESDIPDYVQALEAEIENDFVKGKEINFQDYNFYEYFNYSDVKDAAEKMYRSFLAPEVMDQYYILNSGIREAELNKVIAAETSSIKKAAITASRLENNADAIAESQRIRDEWQMPTTSKLLVEDMISRLEFYKQFLAPNAEPLSYSNKAAHLYFLEKEIAHVEAQGLDSDDYTADSWANYAEALEIAKKVAAGNDPEGFQDYNSRIYDVKYNLMVAYKNLLAKDASLIEAGGTADLEANIAIAEDIFASLEAGDGVWALSEDYEGEADAAYAALISALGYYYVGEDENTWNLYADSAYEYRDNDRPNNQNNQAKVNASNAALEAAIANFVTETAEPVLGGITTGVVDTENGYVYGVAAGEDVNLFFAVENGSFEMVANEAGYKNGTGATLVVKDSKGEEVDHFTLVVFGDVNGDGAVTNADFVAVKGAAAGTDFDVEIYGFAADVNGDSTVTNADFVAVKGAAAGGDITVNPYAA